MGLWLPCSANCRRSRNANRTHYGVSRVLSRCRIGRSMQKRALLFVVAAAIAVSVAGPDAQTPTFRTGIDLATFGVTVVDRKGEYLTNLNLEDFEILEDGQKQTVKYFARGTDIENGPEMHVGLL